GPERRWRGVGEAWEGQWTEKLGLRGKVENNKGKGPEGGGLERDGGEWGQVEGDVRRLRKRIFTASKEGDLKKVRNLQKLMLRSHSNTLVSVRSVTQRSLGRRTPGVDGEVVLRPEDRGRLVRTLTQQPRPTARPVRRVHIPK